MNWHSLSVQQVQSIEAIRKGVKKEDIAADVDTRLLAVIMNKTEDEIDSLPLEKYRDLRGQLSFLETEPEDSQPVEWFQIGKKRYRCIYQIEKMPAARYIEGKTFNENFTDNLHKIAASMVMPQKKTIFGWRDRKYNAADHILYANDLLQAPFMQIRASCLFFYHVYINWIIVMWDYLAEEQCKKGVSKEEAERTLTNLISTLAGSIPPKLLPISTILNLRKHTNFQHWSTSTV